MPSNTNQPFEISNLKLEVSDEWVGDYDAALARTFRRRVGMDYHAAVFRLLQEADIRPGERVLDVTSEDAATTLQLVRRVQPEQVISVCPVEEVLQQAYAKAKAARLEDRIDWRLVSLEQLPFPEESFDAITCSFSFRLLDAKSFIAEAHRLLVPEGRLVVAEQVVEKTKLNQWRIKGRQLYYQYLLKDRAEAEADFYTDDELVDLLQGAGFQQILIRGLQRPRTQHSWVFSIIKATKL
jgi:ubiquinone/menaquinone biosynthesis C-methylase UbiE